MSRIGKLPVTLSDKVNVTLKNNSINVKWPLGELNFAYSKDVEVIEEENTLIVKPLNETAKALWWTTRAIISNMVIWVTDGYKKSLEINWVWYKFEIQGSSLILSIGYSHKVEMKMPEWVKIVTDEKFKNIIHISWIDKQLVWEIASKIRAKKKPEPYKWKWIKYVGELIKRKAWKTWKK